MLPYLHTFSNFVSWLVCSVVFLLFFAGKRARARLPYWSAQLSWARWALSLSREPSFVDSCHVSSQLLSSRWLLKSAVEYNAWFDFWILKPWNCETSKRFVERRSGMFQFLAFVNPRRVIFQVSSQANKLRNKNWKDDLIGLSSFYCRHRGILHRINQSLWVQTLGNTFQE